MSLRARIVSVTLALFTVGLLVAGASTYAFLRSFLTKRIDQQLVSVQVAATRTLIDAAEQQAPGAGQFVVPRFGRGDNASLVPPGTYAELRGADGRRISSVTFGFRDVAVATPKIPTTLPDNGTSSPFTVPSASGRSGHFRAIVQPISNGFVAVVAVPLHEVDVTLHRLLLVELVTAMSVLIAIALASTVLIRRGMRQLDRMGETAGAIAAGDLSRRVEPAGGPTEIGRLGSALNAMLAQIEASFAERRASEARLRRFLSDASHELRTPLTSIRGWAELFRRGASANPDDLARTMRHIEDEAAHMSVLVEDMLSLARLDEGRPLNVQPVDLAALAGAAVENARAVEPDRPISLDAPPELMVDGDATRLRQVLANLLTNTREHTPAGTPVHVRVAGDATSAVIDVADEGPGMDPDHAARVFERFYRADAARTRSGGNSAPAATTVAGGSGAGGSGAGLGLAIVAAIAQAHGGTAQVFTAPGRGATFRVVVPRHADVPAPPAPPTSPPTPTAPPTPAARGIASGKSLTSHP